MKRQTSTGEASQQESRRRQGFGALANNAAGVPQRPQTSPPAFGALATTPHVFPNVRKQRRRHSVPSQTTPLAVRYNAEGVR